MDLAKVLRHIPNFPKQGIDFIDITTVLQNADAFQATVDQMADKVRDVPFSQIVGSESRGFIIGSPLAYARKRASSRYGKK
jgi:adenine phosphoribosyltransferase